MIIRHRFIDPGPTLRELFSGLAFNILCGDTHDHARNHAACWSGRDRCGDGSSIAWLPMVRRKLRATVLAKRYESEATSSNSETRWLARATGAADRSGGRSRRLDQSVRISKAWRPDCALGTI